MSASKQERRLIFEYWFRVLIGSEIIIEDISKIACKFGDQYEMFDALLSHKDFEIKEGKLAFKKLLHQMPGHKSVFGAMVAESGYEYYWKLKLSGDKVGDINVGIIAADKANKQEMWWTKNREGISYYSYDGNIYQFKEEEGGCVISNYGEAFDYDKEAIIDVWLDMKDKYQLSFAKNGKKFGKAADVEDSMKYRLAICIYSNTKVELLSSDS